ncbi:NADP-dependent oxidoreductase [Occultella gossypii]|uniref:NADP-dependent oxidoreductase n=1 Tax=Occultella gossypii TaxID=2800820 RepID=A0ABS7S8L0_9MICO|nr:NADP-dependent oxidoreductase [Occultella gossypii]MBZ2196680.1 NADP-dependent oxidoreductase [Occultella gossypii]
MKAVRFHSHGDSSVLRYEDAATPTAAPGQVVIRVAGTSFNFLDVAIRLGAMADVMPVTLPHIPGIDVAGVVTEVGDGVSGWSAGDAVIAFLPATDDGAAAEYVAVPAAILARAPHSVALADSATLPVGGLTARQALFDHAGLTSGQRILVNGAGGGVGGYAVQLAAATGAKVTATASPRSAERVRAQGAERVVDYTETSVEDALAGDRFDVVLHLVRTSPEEAARLIDLVADGGTFVSTTTPGPADPGRGIHVQQVFVRSDADQLTELVARVDAGELTVDVAERHALSELAAVQDRAVAGQLLGKTILTP